MKMIFKPTFDCIINVGNTTLDAAQGELSISADEKTNILVYPLAGKTEKSQLLPYAFRLENLIKTKECPSHIEIAVFDNEAEITLKPYPLFSAKCGYLVNEERLNYQGKPYTIKINSCGEDNILLYQEGAAILRYTVLNIDEVIISQIDKFAFISGKNNAAFLVVIDLSLCEVCLYKECDKIEINHCDKKVLCLTDLKTSLKHGYIEIYKIADTVTLESEYPTFLEQVEKSNINIKRVFNFFDSVKAKDYVTAKSLLSQNLSHLTSEMLNEYFASYKEIRQTEVDSEFYLLPKGNVSVAERFLIEFSGNLISNIKPV